jgi:hypothetical protein
MTFHALITSIGASIRTWQVRSSNLASAGTAQGATDSARTMKTPAQWRRQMEKLPAKLFRELTHTSDINWPTTISKIS